MPNVGVSAGRGFRFAWEGEVGRYSGKRRIHYASTKDENVIDILDRIKQAGGTSALVVGRNRKHDYLLEPLTVCRFHGNQIEHAIRVQSHGVLKLLAMMGKSDVKEFLMVASNGPAYTIVRQNEIQILQLDYTNDDTESSPAVIRLADFIIQDITRLSMRPELKLPKHIVFIGYLFAKSIELESEIERYFKNLSGGKTPFWDKVALFPPHAEYAGALGALFYGR